MKPCPSFRRSLAENAPTCPHCGYAFALRNDTTLLARIVICLLLIGIGFALVMAIVRWYAGRGYTAGFGRFPGRTAERPS